MRKHIAIMLVILLISAVLSGCNFSPKLGGAERQYMTEEERTQLLTQLQGGTDGSGADLYNENGIIVTADRKLVVETWKLKELADNYTEQHQLDYVVSTENLIKQENDWMTSAVTTKDFICTVRLYGDDTQMTLDIKLDEGYVGKYIIVPQSCIINGVVKDKALFKAKESERGHFLITAQMEDFAKLEMFGLTMGNISSLAWYLTAIDTETKRMESFLIASAFPDDDTWEGLQVSEKFAANSGIVMWVLRSGDSAYLCTFNGSNKKIDTEVTVSAVSGDMISDKFKLDVSSGEFAYQKIGFNVTGVTVKLDDKVLFTEQ